MSHPSNRRRFLGSILAAFAGWLVGATRARTAAPDLEQKPAPPKKALRSDFTLTNEGTITWDGPFEFTTNGIFRLDDNPPSNRP